MHKSQLYIPHLRIIDVSFFRHLKIHDNWLMIKDPMQEKDCNISVIILQLLVLNTIGFAFITYEY